MIYTILAEYEKNHPVEKYYTNMIVFVGTSAKEALEQLKYFSKKYKFLELTSWEDGQVHYFGNSYQVFRKWEAEESFSDDFLEKITPEYIESFEKNTSLIIYSKIDQ
jgi:hypothetical protein